MNSLNTDCLLNKCGSLDGIFVVGKMARQRNRQTIADEIIHVADSLDLAGIDTCDLLAAIRVPKDNLGPRSQTEASIIRLEQATYNCFHFGQN